MRKIAATAVLSIGLQSAIGIAEDKEEVWDVSDVAAANIINVDLVPSNGGFNPEYAAVDIYATIKASNQCMMPEQFAKKITELNSVGASYQLIGLNPPEKRCRMIYQPVTQRVYLGQYTYHQDANPIHISVNGVAGHRRLEIGDVIHHDPIIN